MMTVKEILERMKELSREATGTISLERRKEINDELAYLTELLRLINEEAKKQ